jgi:hypothetical protein
LEQQVIFWQIKNPFTSQYVFPDKATVRRTFIRKQLFSDAEAQPLIAAASNNYDPNFFYKNHSGLSLSEVQDLFASLLPAVQNWERLARPGYEPKVLCGYSDNREMKKVWQALHTRKINIRAIPLGFNYHEDAKETWTKAYWGLPSMLAIDIDENDSSGANYRKFFSDCRCYEAPEIRNFPRPLVTTINPISDNCQHVYQMKWLVEDFRDPEKTMLEYNRIRRELSYLLGADPGFVNHVVRSPLFVAGWHRENPHKTTSRKRIDIDKESLWHHSIWYKPHAYTVAELRQFIADLKTGHYGQVPPLPGDSHERETVASEEKQAFTRRGSGNRFDIDTQRQLARTPACQIKIGRRNAWLFSNLSLNFCRSVAPSFRKTNDFAGFTDAALAKALALNDMLESPLDETEVTATAKSIVGWCMSARFKPCGRTSEEASFIAKLRWGPDHITVSAKAKKLGISRSTYYRRLKAKQPQQRAKTPDAPEAHCRPWNSCWKKRLFDNDSIADLNDIPPSHYDRHRLTAADLLNRIIDQYHQRAPP